MPAYSCSSKSQVEFILNYIFSAHKKVLWASSCDGNHELAEYMLSLTGVQDPTMDDGTTAFSIALARCDISLINLFLSSTISGHLRQQNLAKEAFLEINRDPSKYRSELRDVLVNAVPEDIEPLPNYEPCNK